MDKGHNFYHSLQDVAGLEIGSLHANPAAVYPKLSTAGSLEERKFGGRKNASVFFLHF